MASVKEAGDREFAKGLEKAMKRAGMDQKNLAAAAEVDQSTVSRMVSSGSGNRNSRLSVAKALEMTVAEIYDLGNESTGVHDLDQFFQSSFNPRMRSLIQKNEDISGWMRVELDKLIREAEKRLDENNGK